MKNLYFIFLMVVFVITLKAEVKDDLIGKKAPPISLLRLDNIEFFLVNGSSDLEQRTNPAILEPNRFSDNDLNVLGFNYDFSFGYGHLLYKNQERSLHTNSATLWK